MFIPSATIAPQSRAAVQISNIVVILIIPHFLIHSNSQRTVCISLLCAVFIYPISKSRGQSVEYALSVHAGCRPWH